MMSKRETEFCFLTPNNGRYIVLGIVWYPNPPIYIYIYIYAHTSLLLFYIMSFFGGGTQEQQPAQPDPLFAGTNTHTITSMSFIYTNINKYLYAYCTH